MVCMALQKFTLLVMSADDNQRMIVVGYQDGQQYKIPDKAAQDTHNYRRTLYGKPSAVKQQCTVQLLR